MERVHVHSWQHIGDRAPKGCTIEISGEFPQPVARGTAGLEESMVVHQQNARSIVDALMAHLPGGTVDQVLACLLQRTASRFVVPHDDLPSRVSALEERVDALEGTARE